MPRLRLSLPEEFGPGRAAVTSANPDHSFRRAREPESEPRIVRWLACWAGR